VGSGCGYLSPGEVVAGQGRGESGESEGDDWGAGVGLWVREVSVSWEEFGGDGVGEGVF